MSTLSLCAVQGLGRQWVRRCLDFNNTQRKSKPCLLRCRLKPLLEKIVYPEI